MGNRARGLLALTAMALVVVAAVGCGGSSEAAPLKRSAFIKQGNAICAETQAERADQEEELKDESGESGDSEEAEAVMGVLLGPVDKMTDELGNLGAPAGQEKEVEAIIAAFEKAASNLEEQPTGPKAVSAFDEANQMAVAYGLSECAI